MKFLDARWVYLTAGLLLIVSTGTATAQQGSTLELRGGIAIPAGDLADVADPGASFGIGYSFELGGRLGLRLEGDAEFLSGADLPGTTTAGPGIDVYRYGGGLVLGLLEPADAWDVDVTAGVGLAVFHSDEFDAMGGTVDINETYFTANGGLDVKHALAPSVNVFLGGRLVLMFADEADTALFAQVNSDVDPAGFGTAVMIPLRVGVEFTFY